MNIGGRADAEEPAVRLVKAEFLRALDIAAAARNSTPSATGGLGDAGNRTWWLQATTAVTPSAAATMSQPDPASAGGPIPESVPVPLLLYSLGFGLAGLTVLAQAALALFALVRACRRRHGDCLYGLCAHAAVVGLLQGAYVTVAHTLLQSGGPAALQDPLWRVNCKAYLFCRTLLPGLFLHLLVCIGVAFKTIRYPARRCGRACGRAGRLAVHCLPWALCSGALVPALVMHKDATETAIRGGRCALPELWPWLAPLLALFGLPQVALLLLTCLLCAFKPYATESGDSSAADDEANDGVAGGGGGGGGGELRPSGYVTGNHTQLQHPPGLNRPGADGSGGDSGGFGAAGVTASAVSTPRLLRGRPMRIARLLLIVLNCLEAATQLPYSVISLLQTVLRNRQARHLIPDDTMDIAFWLHLAFFPVASVFLSALVLQLDKAYQLTERELHREARGGKSAAEADEVLYTASMLSSV